MALVVRFHRRCIMTKEEQLAEFISEISKGIIKLGRNDAHRIIEICVGEEARQSFGFARISRFDGNNGKYELYRTVEVTQEQIDKAIKSALEKGPTKQFYWYEIFNFRQEFEGNIYSSSPNIFNL